MLRPWQTQVWLKHSTADTVHTRLVQQLIDDMVSGRLAAGALLPGTRTLAAALGLNRKTVQLAYDELIAQGWLVTQAKRGTFVCERLPEQTVATPYQQLLASAVKAETATAEAVTAPAVTAQAPTKAPVPALAAQTGNDGIPDARLIPFELLARAHRRALISANRKQYLGYGDAQGTPELRTALQQMLTQERYLKLNSGHICTVRGSQMAIYLASRVLKPAEGAVVFEQLTYAPALAAFTDAGFSVLRCNTDKQGLDITQLQQLLAQHKVAAVYTTPHHHYPTTVTMVMERRLQLLQLSQQYGFYIIEDDYDHEFHFDSRPIPPLASLPGAERVVHIGSLSKVFAPGLRLGYLVANSAFIASAVQQILLIDRQGNSLTELALAELLGSGEVKRHIRKCKQLYKSRRDHCVTELNRVFAASVTFDIPAGGLAFWLEFELKLPLSVAQNLPQPHYAIAQHRLGIRFGFGALNETEITAALHRLYQALLPYLA